MNKPTPIPENWDYKLQPVTGPLDCSHLIPTDGQKNPCIQKIQGGYRMDIDIDAEWQSTPNNPNTAITLQIRPVGFTSVSVMEAQSLGLGILPTWNGITPLSDLLGGCREARRLNPGMKKAGVFVVRQYCFFSFGDITAFWGRKMGEKLQKQCDQKRRIKVKNKLANPGKYYIEIVPGSNEWYRVLVDIVDVSAQMGIGGLKQYAAKVNLPLEDKGKMDEYKAKMLEAYTNPELLDEYIAYSAGDCVSELIRSRFVRMVEEIYDSFGITPPKEIAKTTGSLVNQFLSRFLIQKHLKPNLDSEGNPKSEEDIDKGNPTPYLTPIADTDGDIYSDHWILWQASAKKWLESEHRNTTSIFNALVQGGRCKNEMPTVHRIDGIVADADISSCYGRGLEVQPYPMGLATSFEIGHRQTPPTLGKWLKRMKHELVPGLWHIVVDTVEDLSFDQTLIFSKFMSDQKFLRKVKEKLAEEDPEVDVPFALLTRQIQNGIINHDVLQTLQAVCTAKEWSELSEKVVVKAGAGYLKSNRCSTMAEVEQACAEEPGSITVKNTRKGGTVTADTRNRAWYALPLADVVGPLLEKRGGLKALKKEHAGTPLGAEYDAKQNLFKLFINTIYGVLASPYFQTGNTVVANNITARARALAWQMAVACGGVQSITDGSCYDANAVRDWSNKRPGMEALSTYNRPHLIDSNNKRGIHRNIFTKPLGNKEWSFLRNNPDGTVSLMRGDEEIQGAAEKWKIFDDLYLEHLKHFFRGCDIDILFADGGAGQFTFEHKNVYAQVLTQSQSNYRFKTFDGKLKLKARGHSLGKSHFDENGDQIDVPSIMKLFEEIEQGKVTPKPLTFTQQPLKVNAANADTSVIEANSLLAGDSIWKRSRISPISLSLFMWPTADIKKSWETCAEKYKRRLGWGIEAHFYNPETGLIDYVRALKEIQEAIDNGQDWIVSTGFLSKKKYWDTLPENPLIETIERKAPEQLLERTWIAYEGHRIAILVPASIPTDLKDKFILGEANDRFNQMWQEGTIKNKPKIYKIPAAA